MNTIDAGHQDYLVMIFSIVVVGAAGIGMLSAVAHFILSVRKKPRRRSTKSDGTRDSKGKETLILAAETDGSHFATFLFKE